MATATRTAQRPRLKERYEEELRNRLKDLKTLEKVFRLSPDEHAAVRELGDALPVGITPYYASIMSPDGIS